MNSARPPILHDEQPECTDRSQCFGLGHLNDEAYLPLSVPPVGGDDRNAPIVLLEQHTIAARHTTAGGLGVDRPPQHGGLVEKPRLRQGFAFGVDKIRLVGLMQRRAADDGVQRIQVYPRGQHGPHPAVCRT